jgi:hypothetical protein
MKKFIITTGLHHIKGNKFEKTSYTCYGVSDLKSTVVSLLNSGETVTVRNLADQEKIETV